MKEFNVTMLGAKASGKTSVLAAIYECFQHHSKDLYLELFPDNSTRIALSNCLKTLQSSLETIRIGGYFPSAAIRSYVFSLGVPRKEPDLKMTFRDYPGEWVEKKPDEITQYIRESDVLIWAIDAAALMEKKGQYDETYNRTMLIDGFLQEVLSKLPAEQKKLILLVPIKCESYMQKQDTIKKLLAAVEDKHSGLIGTVKRANQHNEQFALAITCIQTLGKVRFSHIEVEEVEGGVVPTFIHVRTSKDNPYQPKYPDQILNYSMPFILRRYVEGLSWVDRVKFFFKGNSPTESFGAAIKQMADMRVENEREGFKVLHGRSLFNLLES